MLKATLTAIWLVFAVAEAATAQQPDRLPQGTLHCRTTGF